MLTLKPEKKNDAIRIPGDLPETTPYILDQKDAYYILNEDIVADGTAIEIAAEGITLDLLAPDFFGEIAVLEGLPRSTSAEALEDAEIERILAARVDSNGSAKGVSRALVGAGLLHHSSETGELILSRPPEKISGRFIVETLLGGETPATFGGDQATLAVEGAADRFADPHAAESPSGKPHPTDHSSEQPSNDASLESDPEQPGKTGPQETVN